MAKYNPYVYVVVESYVPQSTAGLHGPVHIRPIDGEVFPQSINVQCSKKLSEDFPIGTKFKIKAKLTDREGKGEFLYSHHQWEFDVLY